MAFRLTVSWGQGGELCLQTKDVGKMPLTVTAVGYEQTVEPVYLGGAINSKWESSVEVTRRLQRAARVCFGRYNVYRLGLRLRLKVRMLKVEVIETLLYGCITWSPNKHNYDRQTGPPQDAPLVPRLAETEAQRPHPTPRQRSCQKQL